MRVGTSIRSFVARYKKMLTVLSNSRRLYSSFIFPFKKEQSMTKLIFSSFDPLTEALIKNLNSL